MQAQEPDLLSLEIHSAPEGDLGGAEAREPGLHFLHEPLHARRRGVPGLDGEVLEDRVVRLEHARHVVVGGVEELEDRGPGGDLLLQLALELGEAGRGDEVLEVGRVGPFCGLLVRNFIVRCRTVGGKEGRKAKREGEAK